MMKRMGQEEEREGRDDEEDEIGRGEGGRDDEEDEIGEKLTNCCQAKREKGKRGQKKQLLNAVEEIKV